MSAFDSEAFDVAAFDEGAFDFEVVAASFTLSPSGVTVTGERNFGMVGVGTNWGASNPFSITSGPGSEVSYAPINATHATYRINVTGLTGNIVVADSDSGTSQNIEAAEPPAVEEGELRVRGDLHWASGLRRRKREEEEEAELEAAIEAKRNNEAAENLLL